MLRLLPILLCLALTALAISSVMLAQLPARSEPIFFTLAYVQVPVLISALVLVAWLRIEAIALRRRLKSVFQSLPPQEMKRHAGWISAENASGKL